MSNDQTIYFIECGNRIKVGITQQLKSRLRSLEREVGSPAKQIATITGDLRREQSIHKTLRRFRLAGEWYRDCRDVRATIQNCVNNFPAAVATKSEPGNFGRAWKGIFPYKSAEELASRTGVAVRTAAYEISGEREPSAKTIAVFIALCLE